MINAYRFLGYLFLPIIKLNIYLRILNKKEDKERYTERLGFASIKRPKGKLIWIHAASLGEFKSSTLIINKLHTKFNILITTTTLTAANYAIDNFGNKIIHQYIPFDVTKWAKRFLNSWEPSLVLWIESDLWPNILSILKKKSIKCIFVNSRISPKSFKRWKYIKGFYKIITDTFDDIYAQSPIDKNRIEFLTNRKINYIGNLKLALIEKYNDKTELVNFQNKLTNYKILMFASTHEGEEKIFLKFIKKYLSKYKELKIIIAPRHLERSKLIIKMFNKENIRSNIFDHSLNLEEDVFIVNSFGNMGLYYSLSDIVILGGSFVKMGGHNPVEPAYNNCVVMTGPYIYNWENIFLDMKNFNAGFICNNVREVDDFVTNLFYDNTKLNSLKATAKKFAEFNFFKTDKLFTKINNIFKD